MILAAFWAAAAVAQTGAPAKLEAVPVAGSVYVLSGVDTSNVVVSVGDDGILILDDQEAADPAPILAALAQLSARPLRYVVNTHAHLDHTGGNDALGKLAPIIAHRNVRERMVNATEKRSPAALPTITYDGEMTLHLNGEVIRILEVPPGHTDGDSVVFFPKANVVAMGDVFMPPAASYVDRSHGGTILGLIGALEFVLPQIPADAKVIPGHGAVSSRADIARGLEVLKEMKVIVEAAIAAGKTQEQLVAEKPFEKWKDLIVTWAKTDSYVGRFYRELKPGS